MPITEKEAEGGAPEVDLASRFEALAARKVVLAGLIIFAAALAVRVGFFSVQVMHGPQLWSHSSTFWNNELSNIAVNLAAGRGYSSPFGMGSTPTAWLCPLIPLLWAFVIWCMGGTTVHTAIVLVCISALPSAGCAVVYWLIVRHVLRGRPALARSALFVAAIFCVWPEALYQLDFPWYFPWQELAVGVVVLLGMRWIDRPSLKRVVPLGIVAGILALINVTPMPIFAVILLLPVIENRGVRLRVFGYGAVGAALALAVTMPWIVRNAVVLHAFVPLRGNGGFSLWEGNNPDGCVIETRNSRHPHNQPAELHRYERLGEVQYSRVGFRDALIYMRAHPKVTLERIGERAYVIWLTDVTDEWSWDGHKYWNEGRAAIDRAMASTVPAWALLILMIWALATSRLSRLPYKWLFISIVFFLPFPYYFSLAENDYVAILRSWLLVLAVLAFSGEFRKLPELVQGATRKAEG